MNPPSKHAMEAAEILRDGGVHTFLTPAEVVQDAIDAAVKEEMVPLLAAIFVNNDPIKLYSAAPEALKALQKAKTKGWL